MTQNSAQPAATPVVRAEAARYGIDLSTITPTGAGGRIRLDVRAEARRRNPRPVARSAPASVRPPVAVRSLIDRDREVTLDVYGSNPLAEDVRQVGLRTPQGPPPKMFNGGRSDLPAFTASGVDPTVLMQMPFGLRHYAAASTSAAEVYDLMENGNPWGGGTMHHAGLDDAVERIHAWHEGKWHEGDGDAWPA